MVKKEYDKRQTLKRERRPQGDGSCNKNIIDDLAKMCMDEQNTLQSLIQREDIDSDGALGTLIQSYGLSEEDFPWREIQRGSGSDEGQTMMF